MQQKIYKANVVQIFENGDALLQLPEEMCEELDWRPGDTVKLSAEEGKIIIKNLDNDDRKNQLEKQ